MFGKKILSAALAWLAVLSVADASAQAPAKDLIRLPVVGHQQESKPAPVDSVVKLTPEVLYVVESDTDCLVFLSPGGSVSVTKETGPLTMRGKFADGSGKVETRKFTAKYLFLFDAVKDGRDELIIVPVGAKSETEAKRVTFQVGQLPQPPPVDPKPVDPKPVDPKPVTSFRVFLIYESAQTMTAAQNGILYGKAVEDWMTANCTGGKAGWRRRDKDAGGDADATMSAMWAAIKPKLTTVPAVAVEVNGAVEIIPFEADQTKMVAKLNEYRGNK